MKINQKEKILNYLNKHVSITSYDAYIKLGITQLATRISELKEDGYKFKTEWLNKKREDGVVISYKKYMLTEKEMNYETIK